MLIGYARVSRDKQDLAAQVEGLERLGVDAERIYTDKLTGRTAARPGLQSAIAATREGDTFVVTKLDRLGRSVPDLRDITHDLHARGVALQMAGTIYDPTDPFGKFFLTTLAAVAEFEADMISMRTKEGLAVARAKGRLNGKPPKLSQRQHMKVLTEYESGTTTPGELAQDYGVDRATIYRTIDRAKKMREGSQ
ncbi:recombinase family protein [Janibacter anophelis]|uniref:recombinase family protein n=1 Tax=Janibacter anophelis TaxID=319054 RepID=UPI000DF01933|nr:recombinase family protein [Janibacter anophelis]